MKEPLGGMIRGALATGGTGGATQPRQEYAAAGQGECKDMAIPRYTKEPRKSQEFLRDFLGYLGMGKTGLYSD